MSAAILRGSRGLASIARRDRDNYHPAPSPGFHRPASDGTYRTPRTGGLQTLPAILPARVFEAALKRRPLAQGVGDRGRRVVSIVGQTPRDSHGHQLPWVRLLAASCRDVD